MPRACAVGELTLTEAGCSRTRACLGGAQSFDNSDEVLRDTPGAV